MVLVTLIDEQGNIHSFEMGTTQSLGELKDLFTQKTGRAKNTYSFTFRNRVLISDSPTFSGLEYSANDVIRTMPKPGFGMVMPQPQANNMAPNMGFQNMGAPNANMMVNTPQMQQQIKNEAVQLKTFYQTNPYELDQLLENDPELGQALLCDDENFLIQHLTKKKVKQMETKMKENQRVTQLDSDQYNVEYQKEIEKRIAEERHNAQIDKIYQDNPELLVPTTMLYIPMKVNNHDVQAFIDTGAQSTIMSKTFAEHIGISKLIDTRYQGKAV